MKKLIIVIILFFTINALSQDTLYLDSCIELTIRNHPTSKDKDFNQKINDNNQTRFYKQHR